MQLVQQSYERCKGSKEFFTDFYKVFLSQDPRIPGYFEKTDLAKQVIALERSIDYLIMHASGSRIAVTKVEDLGLRHDHSHLNIPPDLYAYWLEALLITVKNHDKEYSENLRTQWIQTLNSGIEKIKSMY